MSQAVESLITPSEAVPPLNLSESADGASSRPARTLALIADDLEAVLAESAGSDPGTARLRAAVEETIPILRSHGRRLVSAATAFLHSVVSPEFEPRAAPAPAPDQDQDAESPPPRIEHEILHRELTGWVAALCALQMSMEVNRVPPAAFNAVVREMVYWRNLVGSALPPEERTAY